MTVAEAPLYVRAHDLAVWVARTTAAWPPSARDLAVAARAAARELAVAAALALTFPADRPAHLRRADEGIVRLRELLRVAVDLDVLKREGLRHAAAELADIGRMVGGWRKRIAGRRRAEVSP